jgi:dihydrofolate reductase
MRKLILQVWLSLDGFAADENGSTGFFESPGLNEYSDKDIFDQMDSIDTIIIGANTYKLFAGFWPEADVNKEMMAEKINTTPKIVFSKSLNSAPWGKWPEAKLVKSDAVEEVRKLKAAPGKDMVIWGSIDLSGSLINAGLVDVLELRIVPVVLGKGKPFFRDFGHQIDFNTGEVKKYPNGLVLLRYAS